MSPDRTPRWEASHPAEASRIPLIRAGVTEFAQQNGAEESVVGDIALAVTEAATNAVLHAFVDREPGTITASAHAGDRAIVVCVIDDGRGMRPRTDSPGLGLGLPMMGQLTSSCDIRERANGTGTEVRMTFVALGVSGPALTPEGESDARLSLLEEVARLAEEGGWPGDDLERMIALLVPSVADAATIDLVDPSGDPYRLCARVAGDESGELAGWLSSRRPRQDQIDAAVAAMQAGDWFLVPIDTAAVERLAHDDADARPMATIGAAWWLNLPLESAGRLMGSLGLGFTAERGDPTAQRAFLEAVADRVARGLANTQVITELRRTRRRLERVLDALGEAVTVTDEHGRVVYANGAAVELLGASSVEEVLATDAAELASRFEITREDGSPVTREELPSFRSIAGQSPEPLLIHTVERATGRARWLLSRAALLDDEALLSVNIVEDVTDVREALARSSST